MSGRHISLVLSLPTILQLRVRIPSTPSMLSSICIIVIVMRKDKKTNNDPCFFKKKSGRGLPNFLKANLATREIKNWRIVHFIVRCCSVFSLFYLLWLMLVLPLEWKNGQKLKLTFGKGAELMPVVRQCWNLTCLCYRDVNRSQWHTTLDRSKWRSQVKMALQFRAH